MNDNPNIVDAYADAIERIEWLEQELYGAGCLARSFERDLAAERQRRLDSDALLTGYIVARAFLCHQIDELLPWALRGSTLPLEWSNGDPVWLPGQVDMQNQIAAGEYTSGRGLNYLDQFSSDDNDEEVNNDNPFF